MSDPLTHCSWPPLAPRYAAALAEAVAFVLAEVDVVGIVATGTLVRDTAQASSDLDLYVLHDAPTRRRVQRFFGDGVPAEIFINPPHAVRGYFAEEHAAGRPITAHMLATGHVVLARGTIVAELRREAAAWLDRPSPPDAAALVRSRYDAATLLEDALDVVEVEPAAAALLLARAVTAMLELWCRVRTGSIPRGKDLLGQAAQVDPALGALARTVFSDRPLPERVAAALGVADVTLGARGFFEWDSGAEPVPRSRP
jgi:predicted nucleotidyltransferase